jgi:hypothetical protein
LNVRDDEGKKLKQVQAASSGGSSGSKQPLQPPAEDKIKDKTEHSNSCNIINNNSIDSKDVDCLLNKSV